MGFKPIDFTKEKNSIKEEFNQVKKGETIGKVDPVRTEKALEEIAVLIDKIYSGKSDLVAYTPQKNTNTPVLSYFGRLDKKSSIVNFKIFLELAGQDLGRKAKLEFEKILEGCWDEK